MERRLRAVTESEQEVLKNERGCHAESWESIFVSSDFNTNQLWHARFEGRIEIGSGSTIINSYVKNYAIGDGCRVEDVKRLECRHSTTFGNGIAVSTINENGGRQVLLWEGLTAQLAYVWALYRHRTEMVARLECMVREYSQSRERAMGEMGDNCTIVGAGFIREVSIAPSVTIEGASLLEQGSILTGSYVGVDVKSRGFIFAQDSRVDTGSGLERCFVGERAIVASGFSAVDSLIFSSSHLENGEAAAIFAGPYTVSHHKSSLLIAGLFSFFNAGSGSNQSNHLFKSGAVHQAIHARGVKFASGAYVMAPAREGAFTMVKGSHSHHHDTEAFPFSYLLEDNGRSTLMPAANLISYGTYRDQKKWRTRDKRCHYRDIITYDPWNPYIVGAMVRGVNTLNAMQEGASDDVQEHIYERVTIRSSQLRRGIGLYNKAIAAAIGAMIEGGDYNNPELNREVICGDWVDIAGATLPKLLVESLLDKIESGAAGLTDFDDELRLFTKSYNDAVSLYGYTLLSQLLGHEPTTQEISGAIASSKSRTEELERQIMSDMRKDCGMQMAVGYGNDSYEKEIKEADFRAVRGL